MTGSITPGSMTRQQIYDRIRETSKDEFVLEEMIRLGFWENGAGATSAPEELIRRAGELSREISDLAQRDARLANPEKALKELHKKRKQEALERRKETKRKNAVKRYDRARAWHARRKEDVLYLGSGVSAGLSTSVPGTIKHGLPAYTSVKALALAMGVSLSELRFLAYDRAVARISHYQRFVIPKKTGGERRISAPMPRLKRAQYWILDNILAKAPLHDAAHGFVPQRSILTNAAVHVGKTVVVNFDLKDFFPTLDFRRVKGLFQALGYAEPVSIALALLTTEPDQDEMTLDGERLFVSRGPRLLPQGAPTSPAITNIVAYRLDRRLSRLAETLGFTYTRYADDLTFSSLGDYAPKVGTLMKAVPEIVSAEGFTINDKKTRIMRAHRRQEVTGLVVNEGVSVPRDRLRQFRAVLHRAETDGLSNIQWGNSKYTMAAIVGFAHFVHMVSPEIGAPFVKRAQSLAEKQRIQPVKSGKSDFRSRSAQGMPPREPWWQPSEKPEPQPDPILIADPNATSQQEDATSATETISRTQTTTSVPRTSSRPVVQEEPSSLVGRIIKSLFRR